MKTGVTIDRMIANKVTDFAFDGKPRDEIYLLPIGGAEWVYKDIHSGRVVTGRDVLPLPQRISPPKPKDYYQFWRNTSRHGITLAELDQNVSLSAEGGRAFGHRFWIDFLIFEQDNSEFEAFLAVAKVLATGGLSTLIEDGFSGLSGVVQDVIEAVEKTGDDYIGGFRLESYRGLPSTLRPQRMAQFNWTPLDDTRLVSASPLLNRHGTVYDMQLPALSTATFSATGSGSSYDLTVSAAVTE